MIQFYAPDIDKEPFLPEGESAHCCRVLRMQNGDEIVVTDGKGYRYLCEITNSNPRKTKIFIKSKERVSDGRNYRLTLAVAPTKNSDRMEWMVEKAVEIGVDKIVLLRCERSERRIQRTERLLKVMISAMKQSLSTDLPVLEELTDFLTFVEMTGEGKQKYFGYCSDTYPRKSLAKELKAGGEVVIMIGPEGDFTQSEVEKAVASGFIPVSFGEKRLRTETAGVYGVCAVSIINSAHGS